MPKGIKINLGDIYGQIEVLEILSNKPRKYICKCLKCDQNVILLSSKVTKQNVCGSCIKYAKIHMYDDLIGQTIGSIKVMRLSDNKGPKNRTLAVCLCPVCNQEFETPIARVKISNMQSCVKCSRNTNLPAGKSIHTELQIDGTSIDGIMRKNINKNSSTGIRGVSKFKNGSYRAYIMFKRKYYHLGLYQTLEDAAHARKLAEQKIYGDFLDWYKDTFPDKYARYFIKDNDSQ